MSELLEQKNGAATTEEVLTPFSRRRFLAGTSCFGAFYALARLIPLPVLAADVAGEARVSKTPAGRKGLCFRAEGRQRTVRDDWLL